MVFRHYILIKTSIMRFCYLKNTAFWPSLAKYTKIHSIELHEKFDNAYLTCQVNFVTKKLLISINIKTFLISFTILLDAELLSALVLSIHLGLNIQFYPLRRNNVDTTNAFDVWWRRTESTQANLH